MQLGEEADKHSNKDFANFTTITYFLATSLQPHSSHSAQDGTWVPCTAVVTCRNLAGLYKLQDLEDSKVVTLPGSPVTPKPKAKLPCPQKAQIFTCRFQSTACSGAWKGASRRIHSLVFLFHMGFLLCIFFFDYFF